MTYTGRCACGSVELTIDGSPMTTRQCWCRHCQRMSGGGPAHNAMFPTDAVTVRGMLAETIHTADSGTEITWEFCPACATPVLAHASIRPQLRMVRMGVLDQPNDLRPQMVIWTSKAPPWALFDPALAHYPEQPPTPPPSPSA